MDREFEGFLDRIEEEIARVRTSTRDQAVHRTAAGLPTLARKVKSLREAAGLSQDGLARASGLSVSAISKLEQHAMDPSWSTVQQLARGLGVSVLEFQAGEEEETPQAEKPKGPTAKKTRRR
jgi:ribosome-binding protein aMBF1 (putative translation factor)